MKKKVLMITGAIMFMFALVANLQYAFSDYGVGSNSIGSFLQAQTGGDTGGESGGDAKQVRGCYCSTSNNQITGYGNICVSGSGACVATTCSSGSQHCVQ